MVDHLNKIVKQNSTTTYKPQREQEEFTHKTHPIVSLQRLIGNRGVQRMLDTGQLNMPRQPAKFIQRKLRNSHQTIPSFQIIQREDAKEGDKKESSFSFDFKLLPPELQMRLGRVMLQADTGEAELKFAHKMMKYSLGYSYGGDISLSAAGGDFKTGLSFNPHTMGAGLKFGQGAFKSSLGFNPATMGGSLSLGYGAPMLPMPGGLSQKMYAGAEGAGGIMGGMANFSDPLSFYGEQSENIDSVMSAVKALQAVGNAKQDTFGAGVSFSYNPQTGMLLKGGLQWLF